MKAADHKRGIAGILWIGICVIIIVAIVAYNIYSGSVDVFHLQFAGQTSLLFLNGVEKAENAASFIERGATYAAHEAVFELSEDGGYESACGRLHGRVVWADLTRKGAESDVEQCYPSIATVTRETLPEYFGRALDYYVALYPIHEVTASFDTIVSENENEKTVFDIGTTSESYLRIALIDDFEGEIANGFSIQPEMQVTLDFSYADILKEHIDTARGIVNECVLEANIGDCFKSTLVTEEGEKSDVACPDDFDSEVFYTMYDAVRACATSDKDEVMCELQLPGVEVDDTFLSYYLIGQRAFSEFSLQNNVEGNVHVEMNGREEVIEEDMDVSVGVLVDGEVQILEEDDPITMHLRYDATGQPSISEVRKLKRQLEGNVFEQNIFSTQYILKKGDVLVFVAHSDVEVLLKQYRSERVPTRDVALFCLKTDIEKEVYDEDVEALQKKNLMFAFGLSYPIVEIPPTVTGIEGEDKEKAEGHIVVSWKPILFEEHGMSVSEYNMYCVTDEFDLDEDLDEIDVSNVAVAARVTASPTNVARDGDGRWYGDITHCFDGEGMVALGEDETETYSVTVTGVKNGVEGSALDFVRVSEADDLAPGVVSFGLKDSAGTVSDVTYGGSGCINLPEEVDGEGSSVQIQFEPLTFSEDGQTDVDSSDGISYFVHVTKDVARTKGLGSCSSTQSCREIDWKTAFYSISSGEGAYDLVSDSNVVLNSGDRVCVSVVAQDRFENVIDGLPYTFIEPVQWENLGYFITEMALKE